MTKSQTSNDSIANNPHANSASKAPSKGSVSQSKGKLPKGKTNSTTTLPRSNSEDKIVNLETHYSRIGGKVWQH